MTLAYQQQISPSSKGLQCRLPQIALIFNGTHFQIIGYDNSIISQFIAQQAGKNFP